jgi:hypothetical protein
MQSDRLPRRNWLVHLCGHDPGWRERVHAAGLSGNAWAMQGCWGDREPACAPEAAARSVAEAEAALRRWSV